jgi:hypothetical protein
VQRGRDEVLPLYELEEPSESSVKEAVEKEEFED